MSRLSVVAVFLFIAAGCGGDDSTDVELAFEANVAGSAVSCSTSYTNLGTSNASAQLADARLFVSGLQLRDQDGNWVAVELDESPFQHQDVALLDFEDGTAACADSGTSEINKVVTGTVADGTYDAVRYDIGVPFALNHNNNATATAPLNVPGMFWTWQGGYKFVRVDWAVTGGVIPRWNVHIGSTMCASNAPTEAPTEACARGNLASVELTDFDPATDTLDIDLSALVASSDIALNSTDTPPGCMSSPGEPDDCTPVFAALGMNFGDGACAESCNGQTTFSVAP